MSFSAGVYTLPTPALVSGQTVSSSENNTVRNDMAASFNLTWLRNGTAAATANIPMGSYKLTGLGAATTSGDALSYGNAAVVTTLTSTSLTATRVPYAGTGGLLQDASTFTFDGTTLTAGGFSGPHNGTVGATTPNTGAFTTLTTSSTVTFNGGTANGVAYLNGSKVLTTGSTLVYDGVTLTAQNSTSADTMAIAASTNSVAITLKGRASDNASAIRFVNNAFNTELSSIADAGTGALAFAIATTGEQMRINSIGVGIKNATPQYPLDVTAASGSVGIQIRGRSSDSIGALLFNNNTSNAGSNVNFIQSLAAASGYMAFGTANTERMRIDASGNVAIGVTSPSAKLQVYGIGSTAANYTNGDATGAALYLQDANGAQGNGGQILFGAVQGVFAGIKGYIDNGTGPSGSIYFQTRSTTGNVNSRMILDGNGNLGLGTGVGPSGWSGNINGVLELKNGTSLASNSAVTATYLTSNAISTNGGSTWLYKVNGNALAYMQQSAQHQWFNSASGTAGNTISLTQAMTLTSSGTLLIGNTSNPSSATGINIVRLRTVGTNNNMAIGPAGGSLGQNSRITFGATFSNNWGGTDYGVRYSGAIEYGAHNGTASPRSWSMRFLLGNDAVGDTPTERMRLDYDGNLLVGTTSSSPNSSAGVKVIPSGSVYIVNASGDGLDYYNTTAAAYRFYVTSGGTIYATNTTISAISDQRFKENIRDLDVGLDAVMALKPRVFDWKEGKGKDIKNDRGFIAQEFEQVFPDLIDEWKDPAPEGEEPYKSVRQDLIPVLVKAIQEQQALIIDLQDRLTKAGL